MKGANRMQKSNHVFWSLLFILGLCGTCLGFVGSETFSTHGKAGSPVNIPLSITTDQVVAGINGELSYDPTYFGNPSLNAGTGASGFIALGNEMEAGKFRFVLYHDPTAGVSVFAPALMFRLEAASPLPSSGVQTLTYATAAASDADGNSLDAVSFSDVSVAFSTSTGNWTLYQ